MSTYAPRDNRTLKGKRPVVNPPPTSNPGRSAPTTFFLRSQSDLERSAQSRGRTMPPPEPQQAHERAPSPAYSSISAKDSDFGVQSLEDAMSETLSSDGAWSREHSTEPYAAHLFPQKHQTAGTKRKVGYPAHPKAVNTGLRHVSSGLPSATGSSAASPVSLRSSNSPFRTQLRRASNSSVNLSQPLTPLKSSPNPESGFPGTPRSESVNSFRLSDEEASVVSETHSQAIESSSGDDDDDRVSELDLNQGREPQLVMPSISMPARRPFTARGKNMGRLKIMVVGPGGVGKTRLIKSICSNCEDIVHVDPAAQTTPNQSITTAKNSNHEATREIMEICASTRPYPFWWSDMESSPGLWRRKSFGESILERNLSFIDTPGLSHPGAMKRILEEVESLQSHNARLENMSDNQLLNLFSGEGGTFVDAVLYLFQPGRDPATESEHAFIRELSRKTNLIPLIARADSSDAQDLVKFREKIRSVLSAINVEWFSVLEVNGESVGLPSFDAASQQAPLEPFAISSALEDNSEIMDASLLMASGYVQPLVPSDLKYFLDRFMSPSNISRMRHSSTKKFIIWRRNQLGNHVNLQKQTLLHSPTFHPTLSPGSSPRFTTDTGSLLSEPSKVLVPYHKSNYYRSASPSAASDLSRPDISTSAHALAKHDSQTTGTEPFRQIRLAKWAQDLQRSLANERKRYDAMYAQPPPEWRLENDGAGAGEKALVSCGQGQEAEHIDRPSRGKLGGDFAVIDPLGILSLGQSLRRRGWFALQVAGGCGLVGAVAWWVLRNWAEVQDWFCGGYGGGPGGFESITPVAVPAPGKSWWEQGKELMAWG